MRFFKKKALKIMTNGSAGYQMSINPLSNFSHLRILFKKDLYNTYFYTKRKDILFDSTVNENILYRKKHLNIVNG